MSTRQIWAQREMYSTYHDGGLGNSASSPPCRCRVSLDLLLYKMLGINFRYLLAEQNFLLQVKLAYQRKVEQPNRLYLLTCLKIWSEVKLVLEIQWTNHRLRWLSCAYHRTHPYQVGPDRLRLNKTHRDPLV
jgi:hypothetical protein